MLFSKNENDQYFILILILIMYMIIYIYIRISVGFLIAGYFFLLKRYFQLRKLSSSPILRVPLYYIKIITLIIICIMEIVSLIISICEIATKNIVRMGSKSIAIIVVYRIFMCVAAIMINHLFNMEAKKQSFVANFRIAHATLCMGFAQLIQTILFITIIDVIYIYIYIV